MKDRELKLLEGIIVPLVTPLSGNGRIDIEGLNNLIEHVIRGGVHGIFILGTTGEAQSLSRVCLLNPNHAHNSICGLSG